VNDLSTRRNPPWPGSLPEWQIQIHDRVRFYNSLMQVSNQKLGIMRLEKLNVPRLDGFSGALGGSDMQ